MGRKKLPVEKLKTYKRLALYPQTKDRAVENAKKKKMSILDYMEDIIPK